jgi:hypothetical protein
LSGGEGINIGCTFGTVILLIWLGVFLQMQNNVKIHNKNKYNSKKIYSIDKSV